MDKAIEIVAAFFSDPFGLLTGSLFLLVMHFPFWFLLGVRHKHSLGEWILLAVIVAIFTAGACGILFLIVYLPVTGLLMKFGFLADKSVPLRPFLWIAFILHIIAQCSLYPVTLLQRRN